MIPVVDNVFSILGYPEIVKSDNGPPFIGHVWKSFMQENGIRHIKITPIWPQANAQAEAFNKPLMNAITTANIIGTSWRREMRKFQRTYRCTPHVPIEFTPRRLMFSRDPQTKLPEVMQHLSVDGDGESKRRSLEAEMSREPTNGPERRLQPWTKETSSWFVDKRQASSPLRLIQRRWLSPVARAQRYLLVLRVDCERPETCRYFALSLTSHRHFKAMSKETIVSSSQAAAIQRLLESIDTSVHN